MDKARTFEFRHDQPECLGILLVNLGTPDSPRPRDVRRYLKEFLWDPRVVEMNRPLWWLILHGIILNTRPRRSAHAYARVWSAAGSPLLDISRQQTTALQGRLEQRLPGSVRVALGMRYGNPSIASALGELRACGARRMLILPAYPQYSATTTASVFDEVTRQLRSWRWLPELRFVNHYHDHPGYIEALAANVRAWQSENGVAEKLVLSFHGIPRDYFDRGDPYYCECQKTGRLLAAALELGPDQWVLTFQSRIGPREWLRPYTDETLQKLAGEGTKNIQVMCPGFSVDCLETLEEIAIENRERFLEAGGEHYQYIPCLNDRPEHISLLANLVDAHIHGWPEATDTPDARELRARLERARALDPIKRRTCRHRA